MLFYIKHSQIIISLRVLLVITLVFTTIPFDLLCQNEKPKDKRSFNEMFQAKLDSLPSNESTKQVESITFNELESQNNLNRFNQSKYQDSESNDGIKILILLGIGAILLGAISNIKRGSAIKFLSSLVYRFSSQYKNDQFNAKVIELKSLLDKGIISQRVYDSRMEDILKERKL
jgi:hypothetical protein